jgi:hypothetical protein
MDCRNCHGATARNGPGHPHYRGFTITPRHTTLAKTPSGRVIGSSQTSAPNDTQHSKQAEVYTVGRIRTSIPASERSPTLALDRTTSGFGGFWTILALFHYHYVHWKEMNCFNKFVWLSLIFWDQLDCQNAGDARKFGHKSCSSCWDMAEWIVPELTFVIASECVHLFFRDLRTLLLSLFVIVLPVA